MAAGSDTAPRSSASFGRRAGAVVIDSLMCMAAAGLLTYPRAPQIASAIVFVLVYTFFTGLFGQTLGMRLCGLSCVDVESGRPIGLPRALLRTFLLQLVVPALILDESGRGLHDRATRSVVVTTTDRS